MTLLNPPLFVAAGGETPDVARLFLADVLGAGVLGSGHLGVTEQATPGMGVTVTPGRAVIPGTQAAAQGSYYCVATAAVQRDVAEADETNDRVDLVCAVVADDFYATGDDEWDVVVVTGTPAADPQEPDVPDTAIVLARVDVAAEASSITDADIEDRRVVVGNARGVLGVGTATSNQGSITSETDLAGLSVTVTVPGGRRLRVAAAVNPANLGDSDGRAQVLVYRDSAQIMSRHVVLRANGQALALDPWTLDTPEAGTYTYKAAMALSGGGGTVTNIAASDNASHLLVEDVGPA